MMKTLSARRVAFVSIILFLGLQIFRVFLVSVIWLYSEVITPEQMALISLGVFALTFIAPLLIRMLGERGLLILTAAGLAIIFFGIQLAGSAKRYLFLSILGMAMFVWFLPYWQRSPRNYQDGNGIPVVSDIGP